MTTVWSGFTLSVYLKENWWEQILKQFFHCTILVYVNYMYFLYSIGRSVFGKTKSFVKKAMLIDIKVHGFDEFDELYFIEESRRRVVHSMSCLSPLPVEFHKSYTFFFYTQNYFNDTFLHLNHTWDLHVSTALADLTFSYGFSENSYVKY